MNDARQRQRSSLLFGFRILLRWRQRRHGMRMRMRSASANANAYANRSELNGTLCVVHWYAIALLVCVLCEMNSCNLHLPKHCGFPYAFSPIYFLLTFLFVWLCSLLSFLLLCHCEHTHLWQALRVDKPSSVSFLFTSNQRACFSCFSFHACFCTTDFPDFESKSRTSLVRFCLPLFLGFFRLSSKHSICAFYLCSTEVSRFKIDFLELLMTAINFRENFVFSKFPKTRKFSRKIPKMWDNFSSIFFVFCRSVQFGFGLASKRKQASSKQGSLVTVYFNR